MNTRAKIRVSLTLLILSGLIAGVDASAGPGAVTKRTSEQIRTCVAEIGKHANYSGAARVVHWIARLEQRSLAELEIRIETSVYLHDREPADRSYTASCVTGTLAELVEFRIGAG